MGGIPASSEELRPLKASSALGSWRSSAAKASTGHTPHFLSLDVPESPRCCQCYSQHFLPRRTASASCTTSRSLPLAAVDKGYCMKQEPPTPGGSLA